MDLKNSTNKPATKSCLIFTESEVKEALIQYAKAKGFSFFGVDYHIRYPDYRLSPFDGGIKIYTEIDGTTAAIERKQ